MALNPNYAAVSGRQEVTEKWALTLPGEFNRREEEAGICFWRPGLTVWLTAYGTEDGLSVADRMARDRGNTPPAATELTETLADGVGRLTYRLSETRKDGVVVKGIYSFAHGAEGQVMVACYFEDEAELDAARRVTGSIEYLLD